MTLIDTRYKAQFRINLVESFACESKNKHLMQKVYLSLK